MQRCVSKLTIIGSDNGLSPDRRQAIIWTNDGLLLIGPLGTNFSEILIEILTFSFKKMRLKVSSAKWQPFCLSLNVLNQFKQYHIAIAVIQLGCQYGFIKPTNPYGYCFLCSSSPRAQHCLYTLECLDNNKHNQGIRMLAIMHCDGHVKIVHRGVLAILMLPKPATHVAKC